MVLVHLLRVGVEPEVDRPGKPDRHDERASATCSDRAESSHEDGEARVVPVPALAVLAVLGPREEEEACHAVGRRQAKQRRHEVVSAREEGVARLRRRIERSARALGLKSRARTAHAGGEAAAGRRVPFEGSQFQPGGTRLE